MNSRVVEAVGRDGLDIDSHAERVRSADQREVIQQLVNEGVPSLGHERIVEVRRCANIRSAMVNKEWLIRRRFAQESYRRPLMAEAYFVGCPAAKRGVDGGRRQRTRRALFGIDAAGKRRFKTIKRIGRENEFGPIINPLEPVRTLDCCYRRVPDPPAP